VHVIAAPLIQEPLTLGEFAAALAAIGGFEPSPLIAIGVSGGPDSLALMILADRWARARDGEALALTVDHRLRAESAAEAALVGRWLAARGIAHEVLVWHGQKPITGIQEAARTARYRLLAGWCAARGCLHLLTAHHREDQIETFLIRRRAGSGVDGLAGMSVIRELPNARLLRPLLGVSRLRLAALLDAEGQEYLRDPSNTNPVFERVRVRLAMQSAGPAPRPAYVERVAGVEQRAGEGQQATILNDIRTNAALRIARESALAALLARAVAVHPAGFALLDPAPILAAGELGERALGRVAATIGGAAYPLRRERLGRLRAGLAGAPDRTRTLGGCRFVPWRGRILVLREIARAAPPARLDPGMPALWDRRFRASLPAEATRTTLGCLGQDGVIELRRWKVAEANALPRLVYPTLPAFSDGEGLVAVPHLLYLRGQGRMPHLAFRPLAPLFGAGFTVV
jgi:tRNA(Ile)-lysidine synthase